VATPKGKTPRKVPAATTAKPRKRTPAKGKGKAQSKGWFNRTVGVAVAAGTLLVIGVLGGWGLGMLRDAAVEEDMAATVPVPGSKPSSYKPKPETGYSKAEIAALERALKAAQDAAEYRDGSVYVPDAEPERLPLWDPRAIDERFDPKVPPPAQPKPDGERRITPPPVAQPAVKQPTKPVPPAAPTVARLPEIPDGAPPWLRYAVAAPEIGGRPMIAVVIDDMGIDRRRTKQIIDLPGPITASFLTYAPDLKAQAKVARAAGKELMLHMPMEPDNATISAGPGVLETSMEAEVIRERLAAGLDSFGDYVGINNHMGSRFTADADGMRPVIEMLRERGLFWLDSRTTGKPAGPALARAMGVPFAERNIFLDHFNNVEGVRAQLVKLEEAARSQGYAVGIGHPKDHTIKALAEWLPTLTAKGFVLVPMSAVVRLRHPES